MFLMQLFGATHNEGVNSFMIAESSGAREPLQLGLLVAEPFSSTTVLIVLTCYVTYNDISACVLC